MSLAIETLSLMGTTLLHRPLAIDIIKTMIYNIDKSIF